MAFSIKDYSLATLIPLAIFCGLLWRLEVEYHGWHGLIWVSYFHYSVPVGFFLFLLWANFQVSASWEKKLLITGVSVFYGVLVYYLLTESLAYIYGRAPQSMMLPIDTPTWFYSLVGSPIIPVLIMPIGAYFILLGFQFRMDWKYLAVSILGMLASPFLSIFLLKLVDHKGGFDLIHTIKSGFLIPFLVFSIGFLLVGISAKNNHEVT